MARDITCYVCTTGNCRRWHALIMKLWDKIVSEVGDDGVYFSVVVGVRESVAKLRCAIETVDVDFEEALKLGKVFAVLEGLVVAVGVF